MGRKDKISIATKYLSNRNFLNEVPVEGKKNSKFQFRLGNYDLYAAQIIRTGNCITLLSTPFNITEASFWNTNHFEDLVKYVFWTFNKSFLLKLLNQVESQPLADLQRCRELLLENSIAYSEPAPANADEELLFCYMKKGNLKKDQKFKLMFSLDEHNRRIILDAVEKRMAAPSPTPLAPEPFPAPSLIVEDSPAKFNKTQVLDFLSLVRPMKGSPKETLHFIADQTVDAGIKFPLFTPVEKLANDKNPYGFNGAIAAIIDHFRQLNYLDKEYTFVQIFRAYLKYSGNTVGKLETFLGSYRQNRYFQDYLTRLKDLKINKLP